jgi:YbaB/EbfC DNA-binding family
MSVVSSYSDTDYAADRELVRRTVERFERLSARLEEINAAFARLNIEARGSDGDVVLSVNHKGQLTSLSLAEGCTVRYTHLGLEELINTTLREAVTVAAAEFGMFTEGAAEEVDVPAAGVVGE